MKWLVVVFAILTCFVLTMYEPTVLAENKFIDELASHEIVSILVVILTITLASIANIHLALNRLLISLRKENVDIEMPVQEARRELSSNAWTLFGLFCLTILILIIKGAEPGVFWLSAIHGSLVSILVINLMVIYDLYSAIYALTSIDIASFSHPEQSGGDGSEPSI